jgi:UDP-2,4-diacetamido-2,4,6-trideoxy-beta-L-altropyranose hydrolase
MGTYAPALEARLADARIQVAHLSIQLGSESDAQQTIDLARRNKAEWVVIDGYHFDADYQRSIKLAELKGLCLDDYAHASYYYADWILNQNISAAETLYSHREPYTQLLLGTRYALLRKEFLPWRGWRREIPPVARKILVTLGGADLDNVTLTAVQALQQLRQERLEVVVLVGASNPHTRNLQSAVRDSPVSTRLVRNATNIPDLMAWADTVVSASGSTCWELAFMGVPALVLVLAENQSEIARGLEQAGMAINLGWFHQVRAAAIQDAVGTLLPDRDRRSRMSAAGQQLVDGFGASRVVEAIQAGFHYDGN